MIRSGQVNVAAALPAMAETQPHRPAVVVPAGRDSRGRAAYAHLTFEQLDDYSTRLARGLGAIGVAPGTRTVLMVTPSLEFFALVFALFKAGAVLVMVDPGMGIRSLGTCLGEARPEAFLGVAKAHLARRLFGWAKGSLRITVAVGGPRLGATHTLDDLLRAGAGDEPPATTRADDVAAILFTSGSTGVPKGAVYTHGHFAAQVDMIRDLYDIRPGEIDLPTFPLFALFDPALGMTAIVPDMDFTRPGSVDPTKILEAIGNFGVTNMFGSPALLDRVGRYGAERGVRLPTLRRVLSAGAPVSAAIIERFASMLSKDAEILTPYGATEALPVATIGSREILGETRQKTAEGAGICVGRPAPGMRVEIIAITDEAVASWDPSLLVPQGTIGEIVVEGPVVTREYFGRPESTRLAKIVDPATGAVRHRMGDLGYFDKEGRLWFCGRKSQRVPTPQGELYTIPCEQVFLRHPCVRRTALVGARRKGSITPVLCVELEPEARRADRRKIQAELLEIAQRHPHTRAIQSVLFHDRFPVDIRHNAKIFREKLAVWAEKKL